MEDYSESNSRSRGVLWTRPQCYSVEVGERRQGEADLVNVHLVLIADRILERTTCQGNPNTPGTHLDRTHLLPRTDRVCPERPVVLKDHPLRLSAAYNWVLSEY